MMNWQSIYHKYHKNVNVDLMEENLIENNGRIMINVDVSVKNVMYVKSNKKNAQSLDMIERIFHLMGHKFSQFQVLSDHFVKKKFSFFVGFKLIYQRSQNYKPKRCLFT